MNNMIFNCLDSEANLLEFKIWLCYLCDLVKLLNFSVSLLPIHKVLLIILFYLIGLLGVLNE